MSTVRYFRHDDAGAPTLTGEVGSLTNLLRKCLVGVGGVAYGSKPSAGWSEEFIGAAANIAVFRNNLGEGASGCYVRVDDNAPLSGGAREATLTAYAAMTGISAGSSPTLDVYMRKSATLSSIARPWLIAADGLTVWIYVWSNGDGVTNASDCTIVGIGDYECIDEISAFRYFALGRRIVNSATGTYSCFSHPSSVSSVYFDTLNAPPISGIGSSVAAFLTYPRCVSPPSSDGGAFGGITWLQMPNPVTGEYLFFQGPVMSSSSGVLGRLRGLSLPCGNGVSLTRAALAPGSDRMIVAHGRDSSGATFTVALDTVGPWS